MNTWGRHVPCGRSLLLGLALAGASLAAPAAVVLLTYQPQFDTMVLKGTPVPFVDSTLVTRLQTLDPTKTRAQVADELKAAVDARLQSMFAGLNLSFTNQLGKVDAIMTAYSGQVFVDRSTKRKTAGFTDQGTRRGLLVVDEFDIDKVFIPPPPADGYIRRLEMHNADTAPHNEVANAMAKTFAHEIGHAFGLGDVNRDQMFIQPDPASGIVVGAEDKVTLDPDAGVMAQGLMILPTAFSATELKFLGKALGTTGAGAQGARQRDVFRIGDVDTFGTEETGTQRDMALALALPLGSVVAEPDDAAGTDVVLGAGLVEFLFTPGEPLAPDLDAAFLQVSLLNAGPGAVQSAWLTIGGVALDIGAAFGSLDAPGMLTTLLLDLDQVPGAIDLLRGASAFGLRLELAEGGVAIDHLRLDVFGQVIPEPSTLALLAAAWLGLVLTRRRLRR